MSALRPCTDVWNDLLPLMKRQLALVYKETGREPMAVCFVMPEGHIATLDPNQSASVFEGHPLALLAVQGIIEKMQPRAVLLISPAQLKPADGGALRRQMLINVDTPDRQQVWSADIVCSGVPLNWRLEMELDKTRPPADDTMYGQFVDMYGTSMLLNIPGLNPHRQADVKYEGEVFDTDKIKTKKGRSGYGKRTA